MSSSISDRPAVIVYISIGNSDDKLTQAEWADYYRKVSQAVRTGHVHGQWVSEPASAWQNACWCIEFDPDTRLVTSDGHEHSRVEWLRRRLTELAREYRQDSIAWAEARTEFLTP